MENYPSNNNNNNNHLQILDPMPLKACPPSSDHQSSCSTQQNVESSFSSVTPLRNNRMYDPKMNRLTAIKRLARNRRKSYPKYGPYPCQWCPKIAKTSQSFAGHMRAHYRRIETAARRAAKQAQQQQQQQQEQQQQQQQQQQQLLTPEEQQAKALDNAKAHAMEQQVKSRVQAKKLARVLAQMNAKAEAQARPKPRAQAPAPEPIPTPTPTSVASGSGKQPLRTNDCHLRLSNCQFGQIISPGDKNNSVSTESISNAIDFISFKKQNAMDFNLYSRRRPIIQNSSSAYVLHHHHNLQAPPGLASSSRSRPSIDVNKKPPVVVKQELFPDVDAKPPPGFHHLLSSEGPHGRRFIIKEERVGFDDDDDDMVECGSLDSLALKL